VEALRGRLDAAIDARDEDALRPLIDEAKRACEDLPPPVHLFLAALELHRKVAINAPVQAGALGATLDRLIGAVHAGEGTEALRLYEQLEKAANGVEWSTGTAATGIGRVRA